MSGSGFWESAKESGAKARNVFVREKKEMGERRAAAKKSKG